MNYSNISQRLQIQVPTATSTIHKRGFANGARSVISRAKTVGLSKRKAATLKLAAAAIALAACAAPIQVAHAQLGRDPFAGNTSHAEENWTTYADATTGGTNRPASTFINGVNTGLANATLFNFGVTAPNPSGAFITSGGNIYSPTSSLILTLTSTYAPALGSFNTVVFSLKTLGNPLDTTGVLLALNGSQAIAPKFSSISMSGSGMGASAQYAFQFDLSGVGGSNNFTIALPGSASSVSFSSSQLDATTTSYASQSVVPEPSSLAFVAAALTGLSVVVVRRRAVAA